MKAKDPSNDIGLKLTSALLTGIRHEEQNFAALASIDTSASPEHATFQRFLMRLGQDYLTKSTTDAANWDLTGLSRRLAIILDDAPSQEVAALQAYRLLTARFGLQHTPRISGPLPVRTRTMIGSRTPDTLPHRTSFGESHRITSSFAGQPHRWRSP